MSPRYITGLDVGTATIKVAIAEVNKHKKLSLVRLIKMPSAGLRRGVVSEVVDAAQKMSVAFGEVRKVSKEALGNIFLGVGSSEMRVQSSVGVVAVSRADYEIYQDDIHRAVQSSQAIDIPRNRIALHWLVKEFVVDGVRNIQDPLGMIGNRLEVSSVLIDDFAPTVKNLTKCVEMLGGGMGGLIVSPLAASRSVLTKNQKELGVVLIDIGFGKTGMSVYEESKLLHTAVFPMGSGNITNDLAIGLKIPIETAEIIKLSFGSALAKDIGSRETVELSKINSELKGTVTKKFIAEIIEVRLAEIFEFVHNELKYLGKTSRLPAGVVLVGGCAKMPGIQDLAKQELKLPVQVGLPDLLPFHIANSDLAAQAEDPEFACAIGLLTWGGDTMFEATRAVQLPVRAVMKRFLRFFVP